MQFKIGKQTILVDDRDSDLLHTSNWHITASGYAARQTSIYSEGKKISKRVWLHKEIFKRVNGSYEGIVDHINRDKFDCRRENLRAATIGQNSANSCSRNGSKSQYIGVVLTEYGFSAQLRHDGKRINLGTFATELEAAQAYDDAARQYHGEFAALNLPDIHKKPIDKREQNRLKEKRFYGVYPSGSKFRVRVTVKNRKVSLGSYDCAIEAAKVYDKYLVENNLHGSHYKQNFS